MNKWVDNRPGSRYHKEGHVRFEFVSKALLLLYKEERDSRRYAPGVVSSFFEVMAAIQSAVNENDLRVLKSLHFEKLQGNRQGQISLRLNKQFRLIVEIEEDNQGKLLRIIEIVDYHS